MSQSGWEGMPFLPVFTAMACLHGLLIWALSARLTDACLCCWPDAAKYFGYDVQLLANGNKEVADKLEQLFLGGSSGKCAIYGGRFLEREDMEREAGNLFVQLQQIIQKNEKDLDRLMTEAGREKQNFSKRLEEVSGTFLKEICSASCEQIRFQPYELAECGGCRLLKVPCNDSTVCAGPNVLAGVLVTIVILLSAGAGVWYYRHKKAEEEGGPKENDDAGSSESSWSSEGSEDTDSPSPSAEKTPKSTKANAPDQSFTKSSPYQNVPPAPSTPYQNVPPFPSTPYQNIPPFPSTPYQNVPPFPSTPYQNVHDIPSPPHIW
ncbi:testis-expressed protein 51 [Paroedura picta]|uniref:testis-expressed protein 51 n=1 Tax=Paroedura picta TaxID=143630 RepID=UPI004056F46C